MHTLRSWGLGTSEAINFRRYRSTCAIHHSCIANHLSRSEGQALRARDLRHIGICSLAVYSLEHQSLPMIRLDSRSVVPPRLELESPLPLVTARPLYSGRPVPRPRCRLNEPRAPAERRDLAVAGR